MLSFLKDVLKTILDGLIQLIISFCIGTVAAAAFCWYYNIPMVFSIVGGILVLGIVVAVISRSY